MDALLIFLLSVIFSTIGIFAIIYYVKKAQAKDLVQKINESYSRLENLEFTSELGSEGKESLGTKAYEIWESFDGPLSKYNDEFVTLLKEAFEFYQKAIMLELEAEKSFTWYKVDKYREVINHLNQAYQEYKYVQHFLQKAMNAGEEVNFMKTKVAEANFVVEERLVGLYRFSTNELTYKTNMLKNVEEFISANKALNALSLLETLEKWLRDLAQFLNNLALEVDKFKAVEKEKKASAKAYGLSLEPVNVENLLTSLAEPIKNGKLSLAKEYLESEKTKSTVFVAEYENFVSKINALKQTTNEIKSLYLVVCGLLDDQYNVAVEFLKTLPYENLSSLKLVTSYPEGFNSKYKFFLDFLNNPNTESLEKVLLSARDLFSSLKATKSQIDKVLERESKIKMIQNSFAKKASQMLGYVKEMTKFVQDNDRFADDEYFSKLDLLNAKIKLAQELFSKKEYLLADEFLSEEEAKIKSLDNELKAQVVSRKVDESALLKKLEDLKNLHQKVRSDLYQYAYCYHPESLTRDKEVLAKLFLPKLPENFYSLEDDVLISFIKSWTPKLEELERNLNNLHYQVMWQKKGYQATLEDITELELNISSELSKLKSLKATLSLDDYSLLIADASNLYNSGTENNSVAADNKREALRNVLSSLKSAIRDLQAKLALKEQKERAKEYQNAINSRKPSSASGPSQVGLNLKKPSGGSQGRPAQRATGISKPSSKAPKPR